MVFQNNFDKLLYSWYATLAYTNVFTTKLTERTNITNETNTAEPNCNDFLLRN